MYLPKEYKDLFPGEKKKNKFGAKGVIIDGHKFPSVKEGKRYQDLKLQEHCGFIKNLEIQPKFVLQEAFRHKGKYYASIKYTADFRYEKDGEIIVEEVKGGKGRKGTRTEAYGIRKRLLLKQNPSINFIET